MQNKENSIKGKYPFFDKGDIDMIRSGLAGISISKLDTMIRLGLAGELVSRLDTICYVVIR